MAWGGSAPVALAVMWFLTTLVFFFLCLRLYTRIVCVASYGIDDHIYAVAFVSRFFVSLLWFSKQAAESSLSKPPSITDKAGPARFFCLFSTSSRICLPIMASAKQWRRSGPRIK